jgi:3-hydroxyisobutyrate dehydrogenase
MKISFLGTGLIGRPMAERLIRAGHFLTVFNRTREKALPLADRGARVAATAVEACESSPVIILMVADGPAVRALLFPEGGGRPGLSGRTVIQMSTIGSGESLALKADVEGAGGEYLEAPVLGGPPQAAQGQLVVLAGATPEQFGRWREIFQALSPAPILCGPVGAGALFKLALNHLIAAETAAFAYSLGLVLRGAIDPDQFMGVLRQSALYAPQFDKKLERMRGRDFDRPTFSEKHLLKDVKLAVEEGRRLELDTGAVEGIEGVVRRAVEAGYGEADYSVLYDVIDTPGR